MSRPTFLYPFTVAAITPEETSGFDVGDE